MSPRRSQKTFGDYFSPAERAFTDFVSRNARSVLTSAARDWHVPGIGIAEQAKVLGALDVSQRALAIDPHQFLVHDKGQGGARQSLLSHALGGGELRLRGGDEDWGGGGAREEPPPSGRPRDARQEPPREVHPPLRPDPREEQCKELSRSITSLRMSRGSWVYERGQVMVELSRTRNAWTNNVRHLERQEERLAALEYQLRLVDQPYPPSLPKPPVKLPHPGPVPDIITEGWINKMKRDIDDLRKHIAVVRDLVRLQEEQFRASQTRVAQIDAKIRELDMQRIEPEREYRLKCGRLAPPLGDLR